MARKHHQDLQAAMLAIWEARDLLRAIYIRLRYPMDWDDVLQHIIETRAQILAKHARRRGVPPGDYLQVIAEPLVKNAAIDYARKFGHTRNGVQIESLTEVKHARLMCRENPAKGLELQELTRQFYDVAARLHGAKAAEQVLLFALANTRDREALARSFGLSFNTLWTRMKDVIWEMRRNAQNR